MWKGDAMTDQTPPDPAAQPANTPQPGYPPAPGYQQSPSGPGAPQPSWLAAPRRPLDLAKLVFIGAWVVLGCYGLWFLYSLTDDNFGDFADRLFGALPQLGTGIFWTGVLLAVSVWLEKQKART
jgi:hypothetical protein